MGVSLWAFRMGSCPQGRRASAWCKVPRLDFHSFPGGGRGAAYRPEAQQETRLKNKTLLIKNPLNSK
ncbi:MAG: hypothetical protein NZ455_09725 [Bacteroidia bacterium]|nr:hypothetical protein [Bacteroidia bacterium]MDW8345912.1 hypothetical protein [Bacteroidia bacterium]